MLVQINLPSDFVADLRRRKELETEIEQSEEEFDDLEQQIADLERERDQKRDEIDELEQERDELVENIKESLPDIFGDLDPGDFEVVQTFGNPIVAQETVVSNNFEVGDAVIARITLDYTNDVVTDLLPGHRGEIKQYDSSDHTWLVEWENIIGRKWHKPEQIRKLI